MGKNGTRWEAKKVMKLATWVRASVLAGLVRRKARQSANLIKNTSGLYREAPLKRGPV